VPGDRSSYEMFADYFMMPNQLSTQLRARTPLAAFSLRDRVHTERSRVGKGVTNILTFHSVIPS